MFLKPKGQSERNALESDPSGKTDGPLKGRFIQRLVYGGVTVFCCVAIIVLGIVLLTKADPVVTTIGEDISTNDLFVAGLLDVTGDSQLRGNATVGGNLGVTGNADIGGTLGVTGDTTFSGNVDVDGNLSVAGTTSFGDAVFAGIDGIRYVDGVTYAQNGAGIQAAIDALPASGGKVILPAGTYSVSSTIVVNKSNVTLEGVGEATKLFLADGANVTVLQAGDGTNPYSGINILNLQIDGNRTNNTWGTRYGIYLNGNVTNSRIEKCYVREVVHSGIVVSSSNDNLVTDNVVRGVGSTGISVSTSYHDVVSANTVSGAGVFGIYLWSGEYGVVSGNSVNDNGMGGIGVYSSPGSSVTGNSVYSNDSTGILIDRISNGTSVSGNAVISNLGEGIKINRALDVTVDGNTVRLNGTGATKYNGIYVYSDYSGQPVDRNIISDNILYGNGGVGRYQINLDGTSPTYINNNKVNDNNISVGTTGAGTINDGGTNTQIFGNFTGVAGEGIFDAQGNSALSILTVTQQGAGDIVDFKDGTTSVFKINDGGNVIMSGNLTTPSINNIIYVDGTKYTQDSTGIQAAIDALPVSGGKVILPAGTYPVDSAITLTKSNITLEGAGKNTILRLIDGFNADVYMISDTGHSGIVITGLAIDANQANQATGIVYGLALSSTTSDSRIENCWFAGASTNRSNIESYADHLVISGCTFSGNHSNATGLHLGGGTDNILTNNVFIGPFYLMYVQNSDNTVISGNEFYSGDVRLWNSTNNAITGNKFRASYLYLRSSSNNSAISGNSIDTAGAYGIRIESSSYSSISSNVIDGTTSAGVYLSNASSYNVIDGNDIQTTGTYGVQEAAATEDYNIISGNTINGATASAVSALGIHSSVYGNKTGASGEGLFDISSVSGATQTALQVTQNGTGKIVSLNAGGAEKLYVNTQGDVYNAQTKKDVWSQMASMPANISYGGDLVYTNDNSFYAIRGGRTTDFYRYSLSDNSWSSVASVPGDIQTGGCMVYTGGDYIYALRGGSAYFYRYSISGNSWSTMTDIPSGVSDGNDLVYTGGDYIYALKGAASATFYRYSISGNSWTAMADAPANSYYEASLVYTGGDHIYFIRAMASSAFYRYSISTDSWTAIASLPGAASYGAAGVYTGGDYIYALRGNSTDDFYRYSISSNSWADSSVSDTPVVVNGTGADLAFANGYIYAFFGDNLSDFYRYSAGSDSNFSTRNNSGLMLRDNVVGEGSISFVSKISSGDAFSMSANTSGTALTVTQQGTGDIVDFKDGSTSVFRIADGGDIIMGGSLTTAGINDTIYVDGVRYSKDQIGIQNAIDDLPSTGGKVVLPEGTYNLDSNLDVAFAYAGGSFVDETTAANDATTNDLNFLAAAPQTDDAYYFGFDRRARGLITSMGTLGVGTWTIAWEYWNGSIWTPLTGVTDGSNGFTSYGSLSYTLPTDWAENTVNSVQKYYIRARVSSFTSITTAPKGTKAYPSYYVVVDKSGVSIEGVGEGTKISANGDAYIDIFACLSVSDVSISNMELDGNGYGYAVFLMNSSYSKIENNYIHDSPVSVYVYISSNNTITKNRIADTGGEGIRVVYGSSTNIISENMISGSGMEGIGMWGNYGPTANNYDNVIKNNVLEGNENGMWVGRWAPRTIISGNVIRNNLNNGINFRVGNPYDDENLRGSVIANNDIYGNAYDGIFLEGGWGSAYENINIESNTINANGYNGIELDSGKYITIKNNHIFDNSQSANNTYAEILIDSGIEAGNNIIEGNVMTEGLTNKAKYGIRESGTGSNNNIYANNYATGAVTANISTQAANDTIYTNNSITFSYGEKIDNATDGRIAVTGDLAPATNLGYNLGTVTVDTTVDLTFSGEATNNEFGGSVASAGDVNGDGFKDVIIGAPGYNTNSGRVYIYYGGSTLNNVADVIITGNPNDYLGSSVASAGDVNGDGYEDVIVSASVTGYAYIYYGGVSMDSVADVTFYGSGIDFLGASVASAGDVNGDGYADVIIGATDANSQYGAAYIYYGGITMDNVADITLNGSVSNVSFGGSVASAGDVNGDGYGDVAVGDVNTNTDTGSAYIYFGGKGMDAVADLTLSGEAAGNYFGNSVASAGDVNGDGFKDVIIGAYRYSTNTGRAYIYYGGITMDNVADVTMTGAGTGYYFGGSVASAGDVDADGYSDVLVGAYGYSTYTGRAYVYYGGSSMNNTLDLTYTGSGTNVSFGKSVASAGDINLDGYQDILVGASQYSTYTGRAYIYTGSGNRWKSVIGQSINVSKNIRINNLLLSGVAMNASDLFGIYTPDWFINDNGSAAFQGLNVGGDVEISQNGTATALTVTQQGAGDIVDFKDGTTSVFKINDGGNIIMSGNLTTPSINNIIYVDGTKYTQDSTGIQAAIDALPVSGGKVILPAGTYNVTSTINIAKSDVTLEGAGDATKLFLANAVNLTVLQVGDGANAYSNVAISSLQVDGNKDNNSGSIFGIYFNTNVAKSRIENCYINNTANDALLIVGGSENVIRGNQIDSAGYDGILISGASKNIIEANKVIDSNTVGINLGGYGTSYNSVIGNYISGSGQGSVSGFGISVWRGNNNTITGNVLYSNLRHGIVTYDTAYNTIESNTLTNCSQAANNTYSAIYLQSNTGASAYSRYNLVSGNTIYESGANKAKYGIEENEVGSDYNFISNNVVNGAVTAAVSTAGAHTTVAGNRDGSGTDALFDITSSAGATQTMLQVTQNGTGDIVDFLDGTTSVFKIADGGNVTMNALSFTQTTVNPLHKGAITDVDPLELNGANRVYVQGEYAYVASYDDDGVEVLDISNPATPVHVGAITDDGTTELDGAYSIYISGKYAYVASSVDDGVEILDISNPAAPTHIGAITDNVNTALDGASSIYISGKYAYVASSVDDGVEILDISNPATPVHVGAIFESGNSATYELDGAFGIYVQGKYAYITALVDNGVEILDISNPAAPIHAGAITDDATTELAGASSVYVSGKYAYITGMIDDGVEIIDISNPAAPAHIGAITDDATTELDGANSVYISGKYAYVTGFVDNGVEILDISNPAAPIHAGAITDDATTELEGACSLYISGKYAYVASTVDDGLEILELAGFDIPTANIGNLSVSALDVVDNANIANNLYVGNGLNIGQGGIYSAGPLTISQNGSGILMDAIDTGVSIFRINKGSIAITRPLDLQVEGDTGVEYNLNFLSNSVSYINSAGPLTISAGDSNSYENLTLTTAGTGDVIVDISASLYGFRVIGSAGKVFSIDPSGNVVIGGIDSSNADLTVKRNITTQGGNLILNNLATPSSVTVTPVGTTGTTTYGYRVSAINGNGETLAASTVSTATGNAILSSTNYNRITWSAVAGATGYKIYGRTASSELYMATVNSPTLYYYDLGTATPSGALPASNTTGGTINYPASDGPLRTLILQPANATIPTVDGATLNKVDATNSSYWVGDYNDTTNQSVYWSWTMPDSYDGGAIDVTYYWSAASTTGSVVWCFQSQGIATDGSQALDTALGSAACTTSTAAGSADYLISKTQSEATSNYSAGQYVTFKVYRDAANGSDDMAGDARLVKIKIEYHIKSESD